MVEAYFDNIESQISRLIASANMRVYVAVAWFTNQRLLDVLIGALKRKVKVKIVILDDLLNRSEFGLEFGTLAEYGASIKFMPSHETLMHNKFCIIDNQVITGSYNWTYNANKNYENIIVVGENETVNNYNLVFESLYSISKDIEHPYKHIKWNEVKEGDFTESRRNLCREVVAKNDINREIRKEKLTKLDLAFKSGNIQDFEKACSMPDKEKCITIMDILTQKPNAYILKLWKEKHGKTDNKYALNSHPRKWIFLPRKIEGNNLKGELRPYAYKDELIFHGLDLNITDIGYIETLRKFRGKHEFGYYSYKSTPEELICIDCANVFCWIFSSPMLNITQPPQWDNTKPRLIYGVNVFCIGKETEDGVITQFYEGWAPNERGMAIQNKFFTKDIHCIDK